MLCVLFESSLIAALTIACFVVTGLSADRGRSALTAPAAIVAVLSLTPEVVVDRVGAASNMRTRAGSSGFRSSTRRRASARCAP